MTPAAEAALTAVGGALAAGALGTLAAAPLAIPMAIVGGLNGAVSGWRGVYAWRRPSGVVAWLLDSTWALTTTAAALAAHAVAAVRGSADYAPTLSRRCNRHVYGRGLQLRRGFAITLGNVVSSAGDVSRPRRAKLVTDHEDVHVWQARWLGPAFPVLYGVFAAAGAVVGATTWLVRRRGRPLGRLVESYAYYCNPLEYWAYCRDDHWPPAGLVAGAGPRRPVVRSFASIGRPRR